MIDILKERLASPQKLGRATCKLLGKGKPHNFGQCQKQVTIQM